MMMMIRMLFLVLYEDLLTYTIHQVFYEIQTIRIIRIVKQQISFTTGRIVFRKRKVRIMDPLNWSKCQPCFQGIRLRKYETLPTRCRIASHPTCFFFFFILAGKSLAEDKQTLSGMDRWLLDKSFASFTALLLHRKGCSK